MFEVEELVVVFSEPNIIQPRDVDVEQAQWVVVKVSVSMVQQLKFVQQQLLQWLPLQ